MRSEYENQSGGAVASKDGLGEPSLTLTAQEIRHLAQFCGMVVQEPTASEAEDERETEIVVSPWPTKGVKGDDGMLTPRKHIAYFEEYPEEGCVPLGSPNAALCAKNKSPLRKKGVLIPADNSFEAINRFVNHVPSPEYEELQWALLGLASVCENEIKARMPKS